MVLPRNLLDGAKQGRKTDTERLEDSEVLLFYDADKMILNHRKMMQRVSSLLNLMRNRRFSTRIPLCTEIKTKVD